MKLQQYPHWCLWRTITKSNAAIKTAIATDGGFANSSDFKTFDSFENCSAASLSGIKCKGLGIGLFDTMENEKLAVIVIDDCLDANLNLTPNAREVVETLNCCTEMSPDGRGIHLYFTVDSDFAVDPGLYITQGDDMSLYISGIDTRFVPVTQKPYAATKPVVLRTRQCGAILQRFFRKPGVEATSKAAAADNWKIPLDLANGIDGRDELMLELWNGGRKHGFEGSDDLALMNKLAFWCNRGKLAMLEAFTHSPYFAQKSEEQKELWQNEKYVNDTIDEAIENTFETAEAGRKVWEKQQKQAAKKAAKQSKPEAAAEFVEIVEPEAADADAPAEPAPEQEKENKKQVEKLFDLLAELGAEYMRDDGGTDYIFIKATETEPSRLMEVNEERVRYYLSGKYLEKYHSHVSGDAVAHAITQMHYQADFMRNEPRKFDLRVSNRPDGIYYDLSNGRGQAVRINQDGWQICENTNIYFKSHKAQTPQVFPVPGERNITSLFDIIKINDEYKCLFLCWLVSCFVPDFSHVIPVLSGEPGSGKTTALKYIKQLIDPVALYNLDIEARDKEFFIATTFNYFLPYDNGDSITKARSNTLCRLISGEGQVLKELYTTSDAKVFNIQRIIAMAGVNAIATRADLLQRCIMIKLNEIDKFHIEDELDLEVQFDALRPYILGSIFTILSEAMRIRPGVELKEKSRMAAFEKWGYAIGEAMQRLGIGYSGAQFLEEYHNNKKVQTDVVISNSVVAMAIVNLMEEKDDWYGSATELLDCVREYAKSELMASNNRGIPQSARSLGHKLPYVKSALRSAGIWVEGPISDMYSKKYSIKKL
ncbi:MAG: hypothetical protein LBM98_08115 [Oscillospiraceae bacterium]|jgi:hypothetical protein|nr:hypothetical protein [Oscillospiraceae bacterium]